MAVVCSGAPVFAQALVLDSFNGATASGSVRAGTSWVGNVTPGPATLAVDGGARDENGWGASGLDLNASTATFLTLTAQRDAGNATPALVLQLEDRALNTQTFSIRTSAFAEGKLTTVQLPIAWSSGFDPAHIAGWTLGGGGVGTVAFRMTFDELALGSSAVAGASIAPQITSVATVQTAVAGQTVSFSVTATGTAPLTYQWMKDTGTPVTGNPSATTATLVLANLAPSAAGNYTCVVANAVGSVVSAAHVLTVTAPVATVALADLTSTYSGTPKSATATTTPAGLAVTFTYDGSATPPVNAGRYAVVATVSDAVFGGNASGTLTIEKAPQTIAFDALPASLLVGTPIALSATASSGGPVAFAVVRGEATLSGTTLTPRDSGEITVRATQAGDANFTAASVDLVLATTKQTQSLTFASISDQPAGTKNVALDAKASSGLPVTFSVLRGPALVIDAGLAITGAGTVVVRASQGGNGTFNAAPDVDRSFTVAAPPPVVAPSIPTTPSAPPPVVAPSTPATPSTPAPASPPATTVPPSTPTPPASPATPGGSTETPPATTPPTGDPIALPPVATATSRLINVSSRTRAGSGDQVAIAGFVISGTTPKQVLVRAIGPSLSRFGVEGAVAALKLELIRGGRIIATNAGWMKGGAGDALAAAAQRAGAFALQGDTADSAVLITLEPGNYTAVISGSEGTAGVGLMEVYDLTSSAADQRLSNLSVRAFSGSGADILIVGFVVEGASPQKVLIRAVGPSLAQFGVSGALARPQLTVFSGSNVLAGNSGWADAPAVAEASASAGAFALPPGSADAGIVLELPPGAYTAQVAGAGGATGVALVEVYELH